MALTSAPHSCILAVVTVVHVGRVAGAVREVQLCSVALHVVQDDGSGPPSISGGPEGLRPLSQEPQLPADHLGIGNPPEVIAHSAPVPLHVHLHSTLVGRVPTNQSDWRRTLTICWVGGGGGGGGGGGNGKKTTFRMTGDDDTWTTREGIPSSSFSYSKQQPNMYLNLQEYPNIS